MGLVENSEKCSDPRCYHTGEPPARPLAAVTRPIQHTFQSKCSWEIGKERPIFIDHGAIVRGPAASEVCRLTINVLRHAALSRTFSVNEWAAIKYGELKSGNCHLDIRRIMHAQTRLIVHVPFSCHSIFLANYRFFKMWCFSRYFRSLMQTPTRHFTQFGNSVQRTEKGSSFQFIFTTKLEAVKATLLARLVNWVRSKVYKWIGSNNNRILKTATFLENVKTQRGWECRQC